MSEMKPLPTNLELADPTCLEISWSDGQSRRYKVRELRDRCPCATCREVRNAPPPPATQLPVLSAAAAAPLQIKRMSPVGNYAYSIEFSDGHTTGLYTLDFLYQLGEVAA